MTKEEGWHKELPEYKALIDERKKLDSFKEKYEREYTSTSYFGVTSKAKKVFREDLTEEQIKEYESLILSLGEAQINYMKIVAPELLAKLHTKK
jgi:hypothetical protein